MKKFKINEHYEIICEVKKTRNGFKHEATLLKDGYEIDSTKICYLNRTWERFEFESVLRKLLNKTKLFTEKEIKNILDDFAERNEKELDKQFRVIAKIAKFGEIFGANKQESNDWKARMLKAGLENQGLIMPDDWDTLSEEEKERRLDSVISHLTKSK
jgi:hypothetical protein